MLVSSDWLAEHLNEPTVRVIEIEAMGPSPYPKGHIPGALNWPWNSNSRFGKIDKRRFRPGKERGI
jgi:thiosulfate/3-mercaptopyruvate sulfurtransferase